MSLPTEALRQTLGEDLFCKVQECKILVVGAGGIGCELLKNLVLTGFRDIHVVDLDTIDVSNLNRQFLFRSHHIGQSKAIVAREVVMALNPNVSVVAHHGNIKSSQFGLDYFRSFSIVFNALDNIDARKHVNRLCLSTGTPLIESGTTGYLGQVTVIQKGETECYECTEKVTPKVYPICTIRSTPEKPVHCVVWAKECYKLLFGSMEESMLWEDPQNSEMSAYMHLIRRPSSSQDLTPLKLLEYAKGVFQGLFELEIIKKLEMDIYKGATKQPIPLRLQDVQSIEGTVQSDEQTIWNLSECTKIFLDCIIEMYTKKECAELIGSWVFDKDDDIAMKFVSAASNLRSHIFHIPFQSLYCIKGIAGNIVPAIATTNAIIAGIQVMEAFKILEHSKQKIREKCKYTYCCRSWDGRGMLLNPVALEKPNPKCYVCCQSVVEITVNTSSMNLHEFIDRVLKSKLGINQPSIMIGTSTIYEEGEDADEFLMLNISKILCDLPAGGIRHGVSILVEDFSQDFQCTINITHEENLDELKYPEGFILGGELQNSQIDVIPSEKSLDQLHEKNKGKRSLDCQYDDTTTKKIRTDESDIMDIDES